MKRVASGATARRDAQRESAEDRLRPAVRDAAVHAGQHPEPVTGAVMTPVFLTSTYAQKGPGEHTGFEYSRTQNPTRFALEAQPGRARGRRAGAWRSTPGVAATTAVLPLLDAGRPRRRAATTLRRHVPALRQGVPAAGPRVQLRRRARPGGGRGGDQPAHASSCWLETPTNPMLRLADIARGRRRLRARAACCSPSTTPS